jgi:hypothetical protein
MRKVQVGFPWSRCSLSVIEWIGAPHTQSLDRFKSPRASLGRSVVRRVNSGNYRMDPCTCVESANSCGLSR